MRLCLWAVAAALVATPALAQQGAGGLAMLQAADANRDGSITRAEAQAGREAAFDRLDTDQDGHLSDAERSVANTRGGGGASRFFQGADANQDGRISHAEMMAMPYRGFDRLDRNHDDVVSTAELEVARTFLQGR